MAVSKLVSILFQNILLYNVTYRAKLNFVSCCTTYITKTTMIVRYKGSLTQNDCNNLATRILV